MISAKAPPNGNLLIGDRVEDNNLPAALADRVPESCNEPGGSEAIDGAAELPEAGECHWFRKWSYM